MFKVFKLDQTVLNERVWWSTGIQQNQTHQKTGINHSSCEVSQTLSSVIKQSGTHTRKIGMDHIQLLF